MSIWPIVLNADDRHNQGIVPVRMRNVKMVRTSDGDGKGKFAAMPTPGKVRHSTPNGGQNIRGGFCEDGTLGGLAFVVAGSTFYEIAPDGTATARGTVAGFDPCLFNSLQGKVYVLGGGIIYAWDGISFGEVTDVNVPYPAQSLASLAQRLFSSQKGTDTNFWSATANGFVWPPLAFAASEARPDEVRNNIVRGSEVLSFGSDTIQPFQAVGGTDDAAFQPLASIVIDYGLLVRDAISQNGQNIMFVDNNRIPRWLAGYTAAQMPAFQLIERLARMNESQINQLRCFSYFDEQKEIHAVRCADRLPSLEYDTELRIWRERTTFGGRDSNWEDGFSWVANGQTFVASPRAPHIWRLDPDVYTDDGRPIERVMTFFVPFRTPGRINSVRPNLKTFNVPLGMQPLMACRYYLDGGTFDSSQQWSFERLFRLGRTGESWVAPEERQFGSATSPNGVLFEFRITQPFGFAMYGMSMNEPPSRIAAAPSQLDTGYEPEAEALFARMDPEPDDFRKEIINDLIVDLKRARIWDVVLALYILRTHAEQWALLNWKSLSYELEVVGAPVWTQDDDYESIDGSNCIITPFIPAAFRYYSQDIDFPGISDSQWGGAFSRELTDDELSDLYEALAVYMAAAA